MVFNQKLTNILSKIMVKIYALSISSIHLDIELVSKVFNRDTESIIVSNPMIKAMIAYNFVDRR